MTSNSVSVAQSLRDRFVLFLAEGFGLGRIPVAPGTFGSLAGLGLGWWLWSWQATAMTRIVLWLAMFLVGIPLCQREAVLRGKKDPGSVVWDEMTAFPLILCLVQDSWPSLLAAFVLFRLFDIAKPWPVKPFERLPGGLGIMADDQIAGLYAMGCLLFLQWAGY
ncbi:MAG: phosphatidylglycerophosphatase A [Planctomycetia bacterium]